MKNGRPKRVNINLNRNHYTKNFKQIVIDKDNIAVFASGHSILNLQEKHLEKIHKKCFTIFINYAYCKFDPKYIDLLFFNDRKVSKWLLIHNWHKKKQNLWLSRNQAFNKETHSIKYIVDYFWTHTDQLKGNYTIVWTLQLIKKYFPKKNILLFGLDGTVKNKINGKYYDEIDKFDLNNRGKNYNVKDKIDKSFEQIKRYITKEQKKNIYNCNLDSEFKYFQKVKWKQILYNK